MGLDAVFADDGVEDSSFCGVTFCHRGTTKVMRATHKATQSIQSTFRSLQGNHHDNHQARHQPATRHPMNCLYSCRRVAQLLSQRLDERLGLIDTVRLRVHLSMCADCAEVEKQMTGVKELAGKLFSGETVA